MNQLLDGSDRTSRVLRCIECQRLRLSRPGNADWTAHAVHQAELPCAGLQPHFSVILTDQQTRPAVRCIDALTIGTVRGEAGDRLNELS